MRPWFPWVVALCSSLGEVALGARSCQVLRVLRPSVSWCPFGCVFGYSLEFRCGCFAFSWAFCAFGDWRCFLLWVRPHVPSWGLPCVVDDGYLLPLVCFKRFLCLAWCSFCLAWLCILVFFALCGLWGRKLCLVGLDAKFSPKSFRPEIACACRFGWLAIIRGYLLRNKISFDDLSENVIYFVGISPNNC